MSTAKKVVSLDELKGIVAQLKVQGRKIVTTNGAFDMLHVGQLTALEESKVLGDVLIVGVNSDSSVKQYKSDKRPVLPEDQRARMVAALECVDYVTIFTETDPKNFLDLVRPNIHTKGGDYRAGELKEAPLVRQNGGEVVIIPGKIQSTTDIINRVLEIYGKG